MRSPSLDQSFILIDTGYEWLAFLSALCNGSLNVPYSFLKEFWVNFRLFYAVSDLLQIALLLSYCLVISNHPYSEYILRDWDCRRNLAANLGQIPGDFYQFMFSGKLSSQVDLQYDRSYFIGLGGVVFNSEEVISEMLIEGFKIFEKLGWWRF